MGKRNNDIGCGTFLVAVIVVLFCWLIGPAICYFDGWLLGNVCQSLFGTTLVNGMNTVFNTTFTVDQLPTIFGTIAMVGGFFKSGTIASKAISKWEK